MTSNWEVIIPKLPTASKTNSTKMSSQNETSDTNKETKWKFMAFGKASGIAK